MTRHRRVVAARGRGGVGLHEVTTPGQLARAHRAARLHHSGRSRPLGGCSSVRPQQVLAPTGSMATFGISAHHGGGQPAVASVVTTRPAPPLPGKPRRQRWPPGSVEGRTAGRGVAVCLIWRRRSRVPVEVMAIAVMLRGHRSVPVDPGRTTGLTTPSDVGRTLVASPLAFWLARCRRSGHSVRLAEGAAVAACVDDAPPARLSPPDGADVEDAGLVDQLVTDDDLSRSLVGDLLVAAKPNITVDVDAAVAICLGTGHLQVLSRTPASGDDSQGAR